MVYILDTINFRWYLVFCFRIQAQAIILLAGNDSSVAQSKTTPMTQAQTPIPQSCSINVFVGNNYCTMLPLSGLPNHLSVTSHVSLQPGGGSSGTNELTAATHRSFSI